jgi:hypothetical protein
MPADRSRRMGTYIVTTVVGEKVRAELPNATYFSKPTVNQNIVMCLCFAV